MNCEQYQSLIGDDADGTLSADEQRRLHEHTTTCASCRAMLDDFRAIHREAARLDRPEPSPRVWQAIAAQLPAADRRPRWRPGVSGGVSWRLLAAAATVLLVVGVTTWVAVRQMPPVAPPAATAGPARPSAADPELVQTVETELKLAEEHYQKAIAGLEQITRAESAQLDPQVAAVLQKNLEVIDQAIGESRAALQTQPTSEVAQESLFDALRSKVLLLQDTVGLINEMRKANPEGTARIASGLNQ